ncbi:rifin [Plasmodium reichenowi]|uniref:Rifin n=1 Tax=Plasmodium reichenowi TaxID=5854 RepID=A0A060RMN1_PLARE|nr:rifin [Plasmodium reichenowi]
MNVHYINILLFALPLNILANTHKKPSIITPHHTPICTSRMLSEKDIRSTNYDNDPQMKEVMDNFNKQTQQRFEEYDERMKTTRQKCKDRCDKEIQKIILKDKLEKELMDKFATLQTYIQSDAIPTCVCEKSLADKTEKFCLNCGKNMGAIAPWWGLVCGVGYAGWTNYVAAIAAKAATKVGIDKAIEGLGNIYDLRNLTVIDWMKMITGENFKSPTLLAQVVQKVNIDVCQPGLNGDTTFCYAEEAMRNKAGKFVQTISQQAAKAAADADQAAASAEAAEVANYASTTSSLSNGITASIVAIVVIILIMVIIYLILRYRRKKKMKKKMQYIKLLEE